MLLKFTDLYSYSILSNCFVGCTDCVGRSFTLILVKTTSWLDFFSLFNFEFINKSGTFLVKTGYLKKRQKNVHDFQW